MDLTHLSLDKQSIGALVSALGAFGSAFAWILARRENKLKEKAQLITVLGRYFDSVRSWGDESVSVLSEAAFLCDLDPAKMLPNQFFETRHRIRWSLSGLIDRGKWFLPNIGADQVGVGKPIAYRGYRQKALSCLVSALRTIECLNCRSQATNLPLRQSLVDAKRHFVSELQQSLQVRSFVEELAEFTGSLNAGGKGEGRAGKPGTDGTFST
jgi:hypothetical protein